MKSVRALYRIGRGPSSSHTMGPAFAATAFRSDLPTDTDHIRVTLFGSLAATGRGHLTDIAIQEAFLPLPVELLWQPREELPLHPNGMKFEALDASLQVLATRTVYSVGGGALMDELGQVDGGGDCYPFSTLAEVLAHCETQGITLWQCVEQFEGEGIWGFLSEIHAAMQRAIRRGLQAEGVLPGDLQLPRKARIYHASALETLTSVRRNGLVFAYALAVSEENASGHEIVTAPTCGACGVLPAALHYLYMQEGADDTQILRALATAGLIGNLIKRNASISGAEVGCQGEVGTACAMAAAAMAQLMGGSLAQIEYAAEMGLEHHLGLTCDPVAGYVQIPCIERNAVAAVRAIDCAAYALLSDGKHRISFDEVVQTMWETGRAIHNDYRETSRAGLAKVVLQQRVKLA
jgi:L-serine dehydratase